MEKAVEIVIHIIVTVVAVIGVAIRMEHRLTKIETEIDWLKRNLNNQRKKE